MRLRFWQAKNTMLNNQMTYALTPFLAGQFVFPGASIPVKFKRYGSFEAALIERVDPELARQDSVYGHDFASPVTFRQRLPEEIRTYTPAVLIAWAKRRRAQRTNDAITRAPYLAKPEYLREIFGPGALQVEEWFRLDRIRDPQVLARVLTVELLLRGH